MEKLVSLLKQQQKTIASAESLTAGLFAAKIAEVSGASAVLKGGLITYQTDIKKQVLHVPQAILDRYGVVSEETAFAMADHARELFQSDIAVSFSGNAGPDAMENKPVGYVCMSIATCEHTYAFHRTFTGSRNEIREQACLYMAKKLMKLLTMQ